MISVAHFKAVEGAQEGDAAVGGQRHGCARRAAARAARQPAQLRAQPPHQPTVPVSCCVPSYGCLQLSRSCLCARRHWAAAVGFGLRAWPRFLGCGGVAQAGRLWRLCRDARRLPLGARAHGCHLRRQLRHETVRLLGCTAGGAFCRAGGVLAPGWDGLGRGLHSDRRQLRG